MSRPKTGEDMALEVTNKAVTVEATTVVEVVNTVTQPAQEVPKEKLPLHLGRNVNTTA
ncbi:MAG: hypothetical protein HY272_01325 [Gammaproteobacteria bacterium]|nr:hypothetical protein [Gammaproteobacteria bacterium]